MDKGNTEPGFTLSNAAKKKLKGLAHSLHPVVTIGQQGLKESIHEEMELALDCHQLVKVKINADDREQRQQLIQLLAEKHRAAVIQTIGHTAVYYRPNKDRADLLAG